MVQVSSIACVEYGAYWRYVDGLMGPVLRSDEWGSDGGEIITDAVLV